MGGKAVHASLPAAAVRPTAGQRPLPVLRARGAAGCGLGGPPALVSEEAWECWALAQTHSCSLPVTRHTPLACSEMPVLVASEMMATSFCGEGKEGQGSRLEAHTVARCTRVYS